MLGCVRCNVFLLMFVMANVLHSILTFKNVFLFATSIVLFFNLSILSALVYAREGV